jgi:hypothetical protein
VKQQKKKEKNKMTENTNTPFEKRCEILADLWLNYKNDVSFSDFIEYNDLGLPLAYAFANGILDYSASEKAKPFINEAWDLLLSGLEQEDTGFESLDGLLSE